MTPGTTGDVKADIPSDWALDDAGKAIGLRIKTKDFMGAIGLINEIAMVAEELDHHPDLHLTGWNHLEVRTYSHDVGRLTERDVNLAGRIDALLKERGLRPEPR